MRSTRKVSGGARTRESNSIGNLMLHLDGSTRMWMLGVAAGHRIVRDRDAEFSERGPIAKSQLLARLRATIAEVDEALGLMDEANADAASRVVARRGDRALGGAARRGALLQCTPGRSS